MKFYAVAAVLGLALIIAGCGTQQAADDMDMAGELFEAGMPADHEVDMYCRVCYVDGGQKMGSYLPTHLDTEHEGHLYKFCADGCKEKFDEDTQRYALKPEDFPEGSHDHDHDHNSDQQSGY